LKSSPSQAGPDIIISYNITNIIPFTVAGRFFSRCLLLSEMYLPGNMFIKQKKKKIKKLFKGKVAAYDVISSGWYIFPSFYP